MARRTHLRAPSEAPRRSRRTPAIAAVVAGLAFGGGAVCSALVGGEEAAAGQQASAGARGEPSAHHSRQALLPADARVEPEPRAHTATVSAGVTATATPADDAHGAEGAAEVHAPDHGGCQHGPGELKSEAEYARMQEDAAAVVSQGTPAILAALTERDPAFRSWIAGALLEDLDAFSEVELAAGLSALAADAEQDRELRELALELLGRSPASGPATVTGLGDLAEDAGLDVELRSMALSALRLLSRERPDLAQQTRAAMLSCAERAPDPWLRADALDGVRAEGASPRQVARLIDYLGAPDADVRNGAARALADSDADQRAAVADALAQALERETSAAAAGTILESVLRVGRGDAEALLAELSSTSIVRSTPELAQQVTDYLELLQGGETDPTRVLRAREARVHERLGMGPASTH